MAVVAIDGPAGSGKSTVARALAAALELPHVDTGAYYRAATLAALRAGIDLDDESAVVEVTAASRITRDNGRTYLDGEDVEQAIRSNDVDITVSTVARHPRVRALLVERQRAAVDQGGGIVEGRDAGTVVVPDADLKVWLHASCEERARRRAGDKLGGVAGPAQEDIVREAAALSERDRRDAPNMVQAPDVYELDTTTLTPELVVEHLVAVLRQKNSEGNI